MSADRAKVLAAAYARNPERFNRRPEPPKLPTAAWINPPSRPTQLQTSRQLGVQRTLTDSENGSSDRLEHAQTTHGTDLVLAEFAGVSGDAILTLRRWTDGADSAVLRVNSAGVLAKMATTSTTDRVVTALRSDDELRLLYLTAVASRVLALPWDDARRIAAGEPAGRVNLAAHTEELRNPCDGAARWCSTVLLHHVGAASHEHTRAAIAASLCSEPASENSRAMAALLAGTDPIHP